MKMAHIIEALCEIEGIEYLDLIGHRRHRRLTVARQRIMYLGRNVVKASLTQIGNALGGRHHTTVLYGEREHSKRIRDRDEADLLMEIVKAAKRIEERSMGRNTRFLERLLEADIG